MSSVLSHTRARFIQLRADVVRSPGGGRRGHLGLASLLAVGVACSSPDFNGPARALDPSQGVWALTLPAHAITLDTLAPYDTLQLVATARNAAGEPLADAPAPTYTTSDSSVRVSATGLLTARAIASEVRVIATLVYQGVRLADTAVITVTGDPNPPAFARLRFGLTAGDSAKIPAPVQQSTFYASASKTLVAVAEDADGNPIPGAPVALSTSAPTYAVVPPTTSTGSVDVAFTQDQSLPGPVWVYASATVYGVTHRDSLQLLVTAPVFQVYTLVAGPGGQGAQLQAGTDAVLSAGGAVWWITNATDSVDVVFDDPTAAAADLGFFGFLNSGGGDILTFGGPECATDFQFTCLRSRSFPRAGTVAWHSPRTGVHGTIHVQ